MQRIMGPYHSNATRPEWSVLKALLLASSLLSPWCLIEGQNVPSQSPRPTPPGGSGAEMRSEDIFSRFAGRILFLTCDLSADDSKQASGVLVSANGFVVTNAHVVEGCRSMTAMQINGSSRRSYSPVLKYYDKKSDMALLKIDGEGFDHFALLTRAVRVGERVYSIGNPRGLEQSISEGIVSGLRDEDGTLWIQHSAPISPGSSGGALISSRGELLGINSWFVKESQSLNFAVPVATLAGAYSEARTLNGSLKFPGPPPVAPAQPPPSFQGYPPVQGDPDRPVVRRVPSLPAPPPVREAPERPVDDFIQKARDATFDSDRDLENFVCKERVTRYASVTQKTDWRAQDLLSYDLGYGDGTEVYRRPNVNGKAVKPGADADSGLWSSGEFGAVAVDLFLPSTAADFRPKGTSTVNSQAVRVYAFLVGKDHSHWRIQVGAQWVMPAYKGTIWIAKETYRVLRIEMEAVDIPRAFAVDYVESALDYRWRSFQDEPRSSLLPSHAEVLACQRGTFNCSRNSIDFRNYLMLPRPAWQNLPWQNLLSSAGRVRDYSVVLPQPVLPLYP